MVSDLIVVDVTMSDFVVAAWVYGIWLHRSRLCGLWIYRSRRYGVRLYSSRCFVMLSKLIVADFMVSDLSINVLIIMFNLYVIAVCGFMWLRNRRHNALRPKIIEVVAQFGRMDLFAPCCPLLCVLNSFSVREYCVVETPELLETSYR